MNPKLLSGGDLAFLGDAYYELYIREYLLNKGITQLAKLHNEDVKYVSREAQYYVITNLMVELTNEEIDIFKRGRNFNYKDKSEAYINASGYEALIGYLYLNKEVERLNYLLKRTIELVEKHE
jgi:ribonuclease-3 family protein